MSSGTDPKSTTDAAGSDQPLGAVTTSAETVKPVKATAIANRAKLDVRQLTIGEHVFIWVLIILVGVVFGAGSSLSLLYRGNSDYVAKNITRDDISAQLSLENRLNERLAFGQPYFSVSMLKASGQRRQSGPDEAKEYLVMVHEAERQGLRPDRTEQERLLKEFLDEPAAIARDKKVGDILAEQLVGSPKSVRLDELKDYLADRQSVDLMQSRLIVVPAIPLATATAAVRALGRIRPNPYGRPDRTPGEQIMVTEVILTATATGATVSDSDPEIAATYNAMIRANAFAVPAATRMQVAWFDRVAAASAALSVVTRDQITAHYANVREKYRLAPAPGASATAPVQYRALDNELERTLATEIAQEKADAQAKLALETLSARIEEQRLEESDAKAYAAVVAAVGLKLSDVQVVEPGPGQQLDFGPFGHYADQAGLMKQEVGRISLPFTTSTGYWLLVRTDAVFAAGRKTLDQVRGEVRAVLAANRNWSDMYASATALRDAAASAGKSGLAQVAKASGYQRWLPAVSNKQLVPYQPIVAPNSGANKPSNESTFAGALTLSNYPVLIEHIPGNDANSPRIALLQMDTLLTTPVPSDAEMVTLTSTFRQYGPLNHRFVLAMEAISKATR